LRERRADIMELACHFLGRYKGGRSLRLSAAAADAMATYDWPGNVRELERTMERAVTLAEGEVIELDDLPPAVRGAYSTTLGPALRRTDNLRLWACRYVRVILDRCHGNKRAACRALGISYHTLQAYLRVPLIAAECQTDVPDAERDDPAGCKPEESSSDGVPGVTG
jgi:DNA-binding NtrC family response regulator